MEPSKRVREVRTLRGVRDVRNLEDEIAPALSRNQVRATPPNAYPRRAAACRCVRRICSGNRSFFGLTLISNAAFVPFQSRAEPVAIDTSQTVLAPRELNKRVTISSVSQYVRWAEWPGPRSPPMLLLRELHR